MAKEFFIPISVAVLSLLTGSANAKMESRPVLASADGNKYKNSDVAHQISGSEAIVKYLLDDQAHELLMVKSESGTLYAYHRSHRSHSSHRSHRSAR